MMKCLGLFCFLPLVNLLSGVSLQDSAGFERSSKRYETVKHVHNQVTHWCNESLGATALFVLNDVNAASYYRATQ